MHACMHASAAVCMALAPVLSQPATSPAAMHAALLHLCNPAAAQVARKSSREMLLSEDGRNAARLAKVLVSIITDLQVPEVR